MTEPHVVTLVHLGCARNLIDSELILARMAEEGLVVSGDLDLARTAVLNTCSFIGPAREESEGALRELLGRKDRGELSRVVVAGCLVQRYRRRLVERFPGVDLFAEISDWRELARSIRRLGEGRTAPAYLEAPGGPGPEREGSRLLSTPSSYAYLRISHGCDRTCSFCAIPIMRGAHRSKPAEALAQEARELIDCGVRELVLVAEDSTLWGRDLGSDLPALVRTLADLEGDHRLRLMYAHPGGFPWGLTELLADHPRVLSYLDIPVQHVSTPVLRAMGRAGSGEAVRRTLDRLLEEVPHLTLRTTLMVGFPGETAEDAALLPELVREYRLGRLGAFLYSHEEGTPAWDGGLEPVPAAEARRRYEAVMEARDEVLAASQSARIGEELEVLVDEAPDGEGVAVGRTEMDAPEVDLVARIRDARVEVGERVRVRVQSTDAESNLVCAPAHSEVP